MNVIASRAKKNFTVISSEAKRHLPSFRAERKQPLALSEAEGGVEKSVYLLFHQHLIIAKISL
jgi:hypothetical protein